MDRITLKLDFLNEFRQKTIFAYFVDKGKHHNHHLFTTNHHHHYNNHYNDDNTCKRQRFFFVFTIIFDTIENF